MNAIFLVFIIIGVMLLTLFGFLLMPIKYKVNNPILKEHEVKKLRKESEFPHIIIKTEDGAELFLRSWIPPSLSNNSKIQCVLMLHGITAHSGAYDFLGQKILAIGYPCFGLDYRGHGLSDGNRADCKARNTWVSDIVSAISELKKIGYKKIILLGHSLGVAAAIYTTRVLEQEIAGLILLSAAKEGKKGVRKEPGLLAKIHIIANAIFRPSKQVIEYYRENIIGLDDPLFNFRYTLRFVRMLDVNQLRLSDNLNIPILVALGDKDELFSIDHSRKLFDELPGNQKTFHVILEAYHAKFPNENWQFLTDWLRINFP